MIRIIPALLLVLAAGGCKSKPARSDSGPRIKTASYATGETVSYSYDSEGRTTRISSTRTGRNEFSYSSGSAEEKRYNPAGEETGLVRYQLNGDGLISKETILKPAGNKERIFLYNANGFITSATDKDGEQRETSVYYYTGERLDSIIKRNNGNQLVYRQLYTYYPNINNTAFPYNESISMRGKQSPQAVKMLSWIFYDTDGKETSRQVLDYKYDTGATGMITRAQVFASGKEIATISYTYY